MRYITRHLQDSLRRINAAWPALLLTGPRQTGKTTLLKHLAEEDSLSRNYVTLDDLEQRALAQSDPGLFLQMHPAPVLIDEVQYAPDLFTYIKIAIDQGAPAGSFWLTGSQIFSMMDNLRESLAGRVALQHLYPLSRREIDGADNGAFLPQLDVLRTQTMVAMSVQDVFRRIWQGSMPALVVSPERDRNVFYESYVATYLERDVRGLYENADPVQFLRFLKAVAARTGQIVNCHAVAADVDIDEKKAKRWLDVLQGLGIVFFCIRTATTCSSGPSKTRNCIFTI